MKKPYEPIGKIKNRKDAYVFKTVEPFSEEEEEIMEFLIESENRDIEVHWECRVDKDGKHVYRFRKREIEICSIYGDWEH